MKKKNLLLTLLSLTLFVGAAANFNYSSFTNVYLAEAVNKIQCTLVINDHEYDKKIIYDTNTPIIINKIEVKDADNGAIINERSLSLSINGTDVSSILTDNGTSAYFTPTIVGTYKLKITVENISKTFSFKTQLKEGTPIFEPLTFSPEAIHNEKYYFPNARATSTKDNSITYIRTVTSTLTGQEFSIGESNKDSNGYYFDFANVSFNNLTDNIGKFYVTIKARNSIGEAVASQVITTKYKLRDAEARRVENLFNTSNWNNATITSSSITFGNGGYYKGCLKLDEGVRFKLKLSNINTPNDWVCLCLAQMPKDNRCVSFDSSLTQSDTGFYFRFYTTGDGIIRLQVSYGDRYGSTTMLTGDYYLGALDNGAVDIQISPFDLEKHQDRFDQFEIRFNGLLFEPIGLSNLSMRETADDEGYVYLSSFNFGSGRISIESPILTVDRDLPTISLNGNIVSKGNIGDLVTLPRARGVDEVDGEITARLASVVAPNNKTITVINNRFMLDLEGDYTVIYSSTDSCGNTAYSNYIIKSINPSPYVPEEDEYDLNELNDVNNAPIIIISLGGSLLFLGAIGLMIFFIKKRY